VALSMVSEPRLSVTLRTLWRTKETKVGPGLGNNKRPDFQELLSDIRLSVWIRRGREQAAQSLVERLTAAIGTPGSVTRHGGLSLGESTHLVDEVRPWRDGDPTCGLTLLHDDHGDVSLPVWPDHVGSQGTRWGQYRLQETAIDDQPPQQSWTAICRTQCETNGLQPSDSKRR